jgi:hypothetical protein
MDLDVSYDFDNEEQVWEGVFYSRLDLCSTSTNTFPLELDEVVSRDCPTHDLIDDALRSFFNIATSSRGTYAYVLCKTTGQLDLTRLTEKYLSSEHDVARCAYILLSSSLNEKHEEYVRRQIVHCLLQVREQQRLCPFLAEP